MTKRIDFQLNLMILTCLSTHPFQADITRPHLKTKTVARVVNHCTVRMCTALKFYSFLDPTLWGLTHWPNVCCMLSQSKYNVKVGMILQGHIRNKYKTTITLLGSDTWAQCSENSRVNFDSIYKSVELILKVVKGRTRFFDPPVLSISLISDLNLVVDLIQRRVSRSAKHSEKDLKNRKTSINLNPASILPWKMEWVDLDRISM